MCQDKAIGDRNKKQNQFRCTISKNITQNVTYTLCHKLVTKQNIFRNNTIKHSKMPHSYRNIGKS